MSDGDLTESTKSESDAFRQYAEERKLKEEREALKLVRLKAQRSGRILGYWAIGWAVLAAIGSVVMMFQEECEAGYSYGSCDGDVTYPYVTWAIASLFLNLVVALSLHTIGSYVEARMTAELAD